MAALFSEGRLIEGARVIFEHVAKLLDARISVQLWDGSMIPLGQDVDSPFYISISGPGVIASLPVQTRNNFNLLLENKTAGYAFEVVGAATGLGYRVDSDGVVFYHPSQPSPPGPDKTVARPRPQDPYVGKISIKGPDGVVIELLLHESDLSEETNRLREKYLQRADEVIKEALLRMEASAGR